jgi:hypothetical protein
MEVPTEPELLALLERDDAEAVLALVPLSVIAETWCRWTRKQSRDDDDPDWWAVEFFLSRGWFFSLDDDRHFAGILALVDAAQTDDELAAIGAGPMECTLSDEDHIVSWLENEALRSPKFRAALRSMCTDAWRLESDKRIRIAAGQPPPDR